LTFQPFAVQCLTCGSTLRVTDASIVGTIVTCPKCQSMVQIQPGGQIAIGQSSVDSEAITQDAIEPQPDQTGPVSPAPLPHSRHSYGVRQIVLVAAVSVTALLIAVALFAGFVHRYRSQAVATATEQNTATTEKEPGDLADDATAGAAFRDRDDTDAAGPTINASDQAESALPVPPAAPVDLDVIDDADIPSELLPNSPIDLETEVTPAENNSGGETESAANAEGLQELPPELAEYTQFLIPDGSLDKPNLQAPPTIDEVPLRGPAEENIDSEPGRRRALNLRGDLGIQLAIRSGGYPPNDLLLLIGQLTTVPIEIDWVAFDLMGVDLRREIAVPAGGVTAEKLLTSITVAIDAKWQIQRQWLLVVPNDEPLARLVAQCTDLSDFGQHQESAAELLKDFSGPANKPVHDDLPPAVERHQQLLAVLASESLRRMRSVAPKVNIDAVWFRRWATNLSDPPIDWPLLSGGVAPPPIDTPISVAGLLLRIARGNQATALVNWNDLVRRGIGPETRLLPEVKNDAAGTLHRALSPWRLQVRDAGGGYWWVGSEATYDRLPMYVWTEPLGDQRTIVEQRIESVRTTNTGNQVQAAYDPVSDRVLLRAPRYLARQLAQILVP